MPLQVPQAMRNQNNPTGESIEMLSTTFRAAALVLALGGLSACANDRTDPPGTVTSRANDRAGDPLNVNNTPDGTRGNPPGTVVSRANERAGDPLNTAGRPDCTPGNPPGTAVSRSLGTTDPSDCAPRRSTRRSQARRSQSRATPARAAVPANSSAGGEAGLGSAATPTPGNAFSTQGR
ncbi:hypothetical protein [Roseomonas sp. WA12]